VGKGAQEREYLKRGCQRTKKKKKKWEGFEKKECAKEADRERPSLRHGPCEKKGRDGKKSLNAGTKVDLTGNALLKLETRKQGKKGPHDVTGKRLQRDNQKNSLESSATGKVGGGGHSLKGKRLLKQRKKRNSEPKTLRPKTID